VISTGNHYWLDIVAGFAIAIAAGLALRQVRRLRAPRPA
jgi:membrane-associated phospholipid phosphatase